MSGFIIGIPKEGEHYPGIPEERVSLTPGGLRELVELGAKVIVEKQAGLASGFTDVDYQGAGAEVVYSHEEVFNRSDLVLKMCPLKLKEIKNMQPNKSLWGPLHLAVTTSAILEVIQEKNLSILGYEIIESATGIKPILKISSEIAGKMAPQIASRLLQSPPGLGMLLNAIPGVPPADVVILGAGVLGTFAAMSFLNLGAKVHVLDIDREKLEYLYTISDGKLVTAIATRENVEKFAGFADVLVLAILVSGEGTPLLISKKVLDKMRRGSVIIDFSIDQGGATEVTRKKGPQPDFYIEDGLIFYAVPNVSSQVPRTSSHAVTYAVLPYLKNMIQQGWPQILKTEASLVKGLYFYEGKCVTSHLRDRCQLHSLHELLRV